MEYGKPAIDVRNLRKSFAEQMVLNGVDLQVAGGETLAILGRSGMGKSVFLKLLIGLQKPDSGSIRIGDQEITSLDLDQLNVIRKKIGFLFQQAALYDSMSIEENVAFPLKRHGKLSPAELKDRVSDLLSRVDMAHHLAKMPSEISGGMQKRVGLARALALDPDILLLDEPTAELDPITAGEIEDLILKLREQRSMTSVVVTHDIHCVRAISTRLALLHEGNILAEGTLKEVQRSPNPLVGQFIKEEALQTI
ncbi:MAG TPA: ATP-binding cassette domain-containing protein [Terriglobia bacterium]|nr:ATP-binding cassette domain-containing protein [Terriglobia bacterium]